MILLDIILLTVSSFVVASGVAYLCWTELRIILLRHQLFYIRDGLWDGAKRLHGFGDPAYREARARLNTAIRVVRWITIPAVVGANCTNGAAPLAPRSTNPELQEAIDAAYARFSEVIVHHLMRHTLCGVALLCAAFVLSLPRRVSAPMSGAANWFNRRFGSPLEPEEVTIWMGSRRFEELSVYEAFSRQDSDCRKETVLQGTP